MPERFKQMNCYILAGGEKKSERDFASSGDLTHLEKGYRRYAAIFEKVKLVIKKTQAKEHYLNYPHICDHTEQGGAAVGLETALKDSGSDAVFIGSSDLVDFPLELPVNLIKNYDGETFLGYRLSKGKELSQPLFAIYSKSRLREHIERNRGKINFADLVSGGRLLPLPEGVDSSCIGG